MSFETINCTVNGTICTLAPDPLLPVCAVVVAAIFILGMLMWILVRIKKENNKANNKKV